MKIQLTIFYLTAIFLTACNNSPSKDVTSEEKAKTYLDMGLRYMEMGELKIAKENLEKALDWDSSNPDIHNAAGALYERIQETENAGNHYKTALRLDTENPQSQNNYGRFLCEHGSPDEGMGHLNIALNMPLNNRRWYALANAGRCLIKLGQKQRAEAYFLEALQLQNDYAPVLLEISKLNYVDGNYLSAKAFLQRYQNVAAHSPESLWYAIQIETALNHKAAAGQYKTQLLNSFPSSDEAKRVQTAISN